MVIPRSRSMSMESRYCSRMKRGSTAPVSSRMRSDSVDLPWSTWLMIEKLRMRSVATGPGRATGVTVTLIVPVPTWDPVLLTVARRAGGDARANRASDRARSARRAEEPLHAEAADDETFLVVAQQLAGPGRAPAVAQLDDRSVPRCGEELVAGVDVVATTADPIGIEADGGVGQSSRQRLEHLVLEPGRSIGQVGHRHVDLPVRLD